MSITQNLMHSSIKKPTISVPNELSVPNVRKKNIREEPFSLLNIS